MAARGTAHSDSRGRSGTPRSLPVTILSRRW